MEKDVLDEILKQWQAVRPDLDAKPMGVVGRILRLAGHLERRANEALKPLNLPIWAFDVLGALRRHGPPFSITPTQLLQSVMLTSGALTNRMDRLEELGLVDRIPSSTDRRSLQVGLTSAGLEVVEQASAIRFSEARDAVQALSAQERKQLAQLLRKMLLNVEE